MVRPSASSSAITMFLPMSWMSPRTVAMTILPPPVSLRAAVRRGMSSSVASRMISPAMMSAEM